MPYICVRSNISGAIAHTRPAWRTTRMLSCRPSPKASHHIRTHSWRTKGCVNPARSTAPFHSPSRARKAALSETRSTEYMAESCGGLPLFTREQIEIQRFGRTHHLLDRVAIGDRFARGIAEPAGERGLLQEFRDRVCESGRIAWFDEQSCHLVNDRLRCAAYARSHRGSAGGHRFEQHVRQGFVQ